MTELALRPGSLIAGRYCLEAPLGEGGMGLVWAATHTVTRRAVAIKFLNESSRLKPDLRQRFIREASAASALRHPNVVDILDVFEIEDHCPVMVMELLLGETLGAKLRRDERLSLEETAALLLPVLSAVGNAHAIGIVHRDLKPENIFLCGAGQEVQVKVLDFGIAKLSAEQFLERGLVGELTETGSMLGTPCYMAPEQATGERIVDYRADVWSLGVLFYECLSGTRPIEGENLAQVVARLMGAGIIPLERLTPELPHEITAAVMQMLTRDPSRRLADLRELSKLLSHHSRTRAPSIPPPASGLLSQRTEFSPSERSPVGPPPSATLLSSPAVGGSVAIEAPRKHSSRRRATFGALALLALVVVGIGLLASRQEQELAQRKALDTSSSAAVLATASPSLPSAAISLPVLSASSPAPARAAGAPRSKSVEISASRTPRRAPVAVKSEPVTQPKALDEDSLFPGRK